MSTDTVLTGAEGPDDDLERKSEIELEPVTKLPLMAPGPGHGAMCKKAARRPRPKITARDRLMILDLWSRSKLPATEFCRLVGVSKHTLYTWRRRFEEYGPAGLEERPRGAPKGSKLPDATRRAILLLKEAHEDWGVDRLHDMLIRTQGFLASASAIARVLREEGYEAQAVPTRPHPDKPRRFERAKPNQLWQSDIFTFLLKRENRRVYLIAFLDDRSRFITGHGLFGSSSGALVKEVFLTAVANFGPPAELLTDQGPQYHTWRGKSAFTKLLESRGVKQVVARARHPQTLGKIERFWGTLWRECVMSAIYRGLEDARERIRHFIDYYNFQRTHQGIDGLVPADRYFEAAPEVKATLEKRVAENAAEIARNGAPVKPFYMTGKVGEESVSLHAEGQKVVLTKGDGTRQEVALTAPGSEEEDDVPAPGTSPLDEVLEELAAEEPGGEE
jgi:transposase InsO family protein